MKLSNLKSAVYFGLAIFYLYIIGTSVFRNTEGMSTQIETIENKESNMDEKKENMDVFRKKLLVLIKDQYKIRYPYQAKKW
jgi:hypothetical protein